jgi:hypothetical protein
MQRSVLLALVAIAALSSAALAQSAPPEPKEPTAAPDAPKPAPEANVASNPRPAAPAGGPADICKELVGYLQEKQQKESAQPQANAAAAPAQPSQPQQVTLEQAQALAQASDLSGCQKAAQQMRRAGVALPPALIALSGLREDLLRGAR